jgi:hypothetical protein
MAFQMAFEGWIELEKTEIDQERTFLVGQQIIAQFSETVYWERHINQKYSYNSYN